MSNVDPHSELNTNESQETSAQDTASVDTVMGSEGDAVQKLEAELKEARDRELRTQAELENFRKRLTRDLEQQLKFATLPFARDLLEVIDNLNRAVQVAETTAPQDPLLEGVKLVQQQIMQVFSKYNCKPIEAVGKEFDPNFHQAIAQAPHDSIESGKISLEASVGYMMHDRVIRPSQVIVSTGPAT